LLVVTSLATNLGLLGYFKYGTFVLDNFVVLLSTMGIHYVPAELDIILPVGISFYTFQTLSYTLDVYRGHLRPAGSFLDFALFVTFFPQLVAGPIVRAADFLPQTTVETRADNSQLAWGLALMVLGLFQKIAIADGLLAPIVETVFDSNLAPSPLAAGFGTLAFAGQIFCDFAGYSTIAIGAAMCLGFSLPDNFRFPYAAIGFSDFWQRWHISLSSWLRDYLYISMGGSRHGETMRYRNLMVTMLLGGLWHGASWNFVAWGFLHGMYLILERGAVALFGASHIWQTALSRLALTGITFGFVCIAWIFFRADTFQRSCEIILGLSTLGPRELWLSSSDMFTVGAVMSTLVALHILLRDTTLEAAAARIPIIAKILIIVSMVVAIALSPGEDRAFIYFQF
jgi:D-alanyl-lipoteichoic acid acyltransferase DltB (MBOAT superfamily)